MIFDIFPTQIECLDSKQLVELLKRLLHAEAQRSGISLRGVSVPLQITVPDGGEDARISWTGGLEQTDYLPSRFTILQCKATDPGPSGWKKEVWTKSSQKKGARRTLNEAVTKAISEHGSYIGFTSSTVIGAKYDKRIEGIKLGIRETGADPEHLVAIEIYDANKIALWSSQHPAVAVWLNELQSGLVLKSFRTIENWGKKTEISSIQCVDDKAERYLLGGKDLYGQQEREVLGKNTLTCQQAKERIADHLAEAQNCVRIIGPSGVGKTRFVYEVFKDKTTLAKSSLSTSAFYVDFRDIGHLFFQTIQSFSESGSTALMIIDECPREAADKICDYVSIDGGKFKVLTIGNDDRPITKNNCLNISVSTADDALVEGIIRQRFPKAEDSDVSFIKNLSGGYPRIAVLATDNYSEKSPILKSVEDVVERILTGCNITQNEQVRAIECLSLFKRIGADEELSDQLDLVAKNLARQTGDEMYEHLAEAAKHHIVDRRNRFFLAQPLPIAVFLGTRRLDLLRVTTILHFIENAPQNLLISFLNQWRHFDVSKTAVTVAERLLARDGKFGSLEILNTEFGSQCLDALVHVSPDAVLDTFNRVFIPLSVDELTEVKSGRRHLVWALEKLAFQKRSFPLAARLLMRLAAAENESYGNSATGLFKGFFQLYLCGTEADPVDRFAVLDEGLVSEDRRIISVCIEALVSTLNRGHFSRSGGSDQIGSQPPLKDWHPKLWSEIFGFHRSGLQRLSDIRYKHEQFADRCEKSIASHIRTLLCENLFCDVERVVLNIAKEKGIWLEAIEGVGDWLYFDRKGASEEFSTKIRELYDHLMPTDTIQKARLYTKFWTSDIRNPDLNYGENEGSGNDYEYSSRKAREVAEEIATDIELADRAIQMMAAEELHNAFPFAHELAMRVAEPVNSFKKAVHVFEKSVERKGIQFIRGMLAGIDERDKKLSGECIKIALKSEVLKNQMVNIYTAVTISEERLRDIVRSLSSGTMAAADCVSLSYGRGLENLSAENVLLLVNELVNNHDAEGSWTALEIVSMYQHSRVELDRQLSEWIKQQITSPKLLGYVRKATRDGYSFEQLISLVQKHFGIDDDFAVELSKQFTRLCQVENYDVFSALDEPARKIIKQLVKVKPKCIWDVFSRFFEIATSLEAHWLNDLVGPSERGLDGWGHNAEGALYGVSDSDCIDWAKSDPSIRSPFLCIFYPLLEKNETGDCNWHPSIERLTIEFGGVEEFRQALARRFHPSSWCGSIIPHLEVYLAPLGTWFNHPVPALALWARDMVRSLERHISAEKKREEEDPYR
jgi:hypothetical protein